MKIFDQFCVKFVFVVTIMASWTFLGSLCVEDFSQMDKVVNLMGCFNTSMTLTCKSPSVILVKAASYGRASSAVCPRGKNAYDGCDLVDKKTVVKDMCDYRNKCDIFISLQTFGNHCPLVDKYLSVIWVCEQNPDKPTISSTKEPIATNYSLHHMNYTTTNKTHPTTIPTTTRKPPTKKITLRRNSPVRSTSGPTAITFNPNAPNANSILSNTAVGTMDKACSSRKLTLMVMMMVMVLNFII